MSTKWGITLLAVGAYLLAWALAGLNATSGAAQAGYAVMLVLGFVATGWSMVLPWDGGKKPPADAAPGPVPRG